MIFWKTLFLGEFLIFSHEILVVGASGARKSKNIFSAKFQQHVGKVQFLQCEKQQKYEKFYLEREHIQALMGVS